jgi:Protein of unknown function (DUF2975)
LEVRANGTTWEGRTNPCFTYRSSIDCHRNSTEGWALGKLTVGALRAVLVVVLAGTVFSHAAFRYVDVVIGAIVAAALVWFAVTVLNAPGQRADPGVTVIKGGVGVAILGVALLVLVLRMLLAQAVARDVEAAQMQAELDEVI